ncbi:MAG: S1C family serine protease [Treponema sp.]|nr:S1C family serine protease [Treponema sp.]
MQLFLISCTSIKDPKEVPQLIDYTDDDVVASEIERINKFKEVEPVKAFWRAILLGRQDVISDCQEIVYGKLEEALEEKDYFSVNKYYLSLKSYGFEFSQEILDKINALVYADIPGLAQENTMTPASIEECLKATVTIWLDRGVKVENGAGFADIVIGSGFFIDPRGYLITNYHVIESMVDTSYEGFARLFIKQIGDDDVKIPAKVIGYDSVLDLALLKVEITPEHVLSLGSSSDLQLGDKISVIGAPLGLEGTLTSGVISTVDRKLLTFGNVFQIDAAVNSGNSGGPLIDKDMKVQAIVFAGMLQYQGLNFAIPVEYLKQELPVLYSNGQGGELIHPWLGCYGHTKRNGNDRVGLEIQYIMPGSSASFSGLKVNDVITEIDGKSVKTLEDLQFLYMAYQYETMLNCKYIDENGDKKEAFIYLEKRPKYPFQKIYQSDFVYNTFLPAFGMKLIGVSSTNRNTYKIERVIRGSLADQSTFSENDLVQIKDIHYDDENGGFYAIINTQRQKKGNLDLMMTLSSSYDSPYYF